MKEEKINLEKTEIFDALPCAMAYCRIAFLEDGRTECFLEKGNQAFFQCVGYHAEDWKNTTDSIAKVITMGDRSKFQRILEKIVTHCDEVCSEEFNVLTEEGKIRFVQWNGKYVSGQEEDQRIFFYCVNLERYSNEKNELMDQLNNAENHKKKFKSLIYEMPVGVAIVRGGMQPVLQEANAEFYAVTGYSVQEISEQVDFFSDWVYPEDRGKLEDAMEDGKSNQNTVPVEIRILAKDHRIRWGKFLCRIFYYKDAVPYYILNCWDITTDKNLENKLQILEEKCRLLEEITDELTFDYDVVRHRFWIPAKFQRESSSPLPEYIDFESVVEKIYEEDQENFRKVFETAAEKEMSGTIEFRIRYKEDYETDHYVWYRTVYRSIAGSGQQITRIIGKTYNISSDREKQERLSEEARLDPLTRLLNKVATGEEVDEFLKQNLDGTHVLFLIDVDNFKQVNDTFGHTVGDTVLSDLAGMIRRQFRSTDIVGRVGGDEFVVFMKNTTIKDARIKAGQLCENIQKHLYGEGEEIVITLSVGISIVGIHGANYRALFEKADHAMYQIKKNGKNAYSFAEESVIMRKERHEKPREEIESDIAKRENVDTEFLYFAFHLLAHARDLDVSLNVLLEQIGKRFQLSMVATCELYDDRPEMLITNCWSNIGKIYEKNVLPREWKQFEEAEVGQLIERKETETEQFVLENWDKNRERIKNMATIKYEFSNERIGAMAIGTTQENVVWGKEIAETLCELSHVVAVFVTLRNKIRDDKQMIHLLKHRDRLTGLYDRDTFQDKFEKEMKVRDRNMVYALVVLDINNFSYVNENFGSIVGDRILCEVADLLSKKAKYAMFSSHMYSDYFVSLLRSDRKEEITDVVAIRNKSFEKELKEKYPAGGINISTGIYFIEEEESFENVLESANLARKCAKEQKITTGVIYENSMRQKRDDLVQISSKFYEAIQKREFEVFLQPKFLLGERKVYGAEALARWRLEDGSLLSPGRFIPPLESMGYIIDLDFYIFEQLVRIMKKWMDAGKHLITVSTNFSGKHFENGGQEFIERIQNVMKHSQVPAEFIEIEITESVVVEKIDHLKECMAKLRQMGFRIAIDDFGTGYSSLNVLFEIPANVIKMDKTFTDKLNLQKQRQFVASMGQLIKATKEEVIFEGIETEEQLGFLKSCGFQYGQGFLFDRPIAVEEFEKKYM